MRLPIASDGWRFIIPLWGAGAGFLWMGGWGFIPAALAIGLALFSTYFFRDFDQDTKIDDALIYSPGDGKVVDVSTVEKGDYAGWRIIRIFLSVFDVHVQRSPVQGKVTDVRYKKGLFLDARDLRAHVDNEQNSLTLTSARGTLVVVQIAGLIARRIVCWAKAGDTVGQGQRFGLIRFGSQVDLLMPPATDVSVSVGQRVVGGKTVVAKWR